MGYLDGLTATTFHRDDAGRTVFFPHGVYGAGYVLQPAERERRVRRFVALYIAAVIPVVVVASLVLPPVTTPIGLAALTATVVAAVVVYEIIIGRLLGGLERVAAQSGGWSLMRRLDAQAHGFGHRWVVSLNVGAVAFVVLGFIALGLWAGPLAQRASAVGVAATGLLCVGFFGVAAAQFSRELRALGITTAKIVGLDAAVVIAVGVLVLGAVGVASSVPPGGTAMFAPDGDHPVPSFAVGGFPHEDPVLEDRMPDFAAGVSLKVWSVRGEHALEAGKALISDLAKSVDRPIDDVSMAVSGRSTSSDPPNWTFAYHVDGASGDDLLALLQARSAQYAAPLERRIVGGRSVLAPTDGSVGYLYADDDAAFVVSAVDPATADELLAQIDPPPTVYGGAASGFSVAIPPDWAVLTSETSQDPTVIAGLKARHPELASALDVVAGGVPTSGPSLVGLRSTTEDAAPALRVATVGDCVGPGGAIDGDQVAAAIRDQYRLDSLPDHRLVTLSAGQAWELSWAGTLGGQPGPPSEFLMHVMTSGSNCLEILFVTSEGRMGTYSEAFSAILASVRLAPAS